MEEILRLKAGRLNPVSSQLLYKKKKSFLVVLFYQGNSYYIQIQRNHNSISLNQGGTAMSLPSPTPYDS